MSGLSGIFGGGGSKQPDIKPPAPPPPPTRDDAAERAQQELANRTARQKAGGMEGTILTSARGDETQANVGKKVLLGN